MQVQDSNIFRHYVAASVERDGMILFLFPLAKDSSVIPGENLGVTLKVTPLWPEGRIAMNFSDHHLLTL